MFEDFSGIVGVAIGAVGSILTGIGAWYAAVRKHSVDETAQALGAWKELVEPMQEEITRLKEEIASLRKEKEMESLLYVKEINELKIENQDMRTRIKLLEKHDDKQ